MLSNTHLKTVTQLQPLLRLKKWRGDFLWLKIEKVLLCAGSPIGLRVFGVCGSLYEHRGITAGNKSMIGQWVFCYVVPPVKIINAIQNPISTEPLLSWNTEKIWVTIYESVFNEEILTCLFWFTVVDGVRACEADNEYRNVSLNTQIIYKTLGVWTGRGRLHAKRDRGTIILHSL